LGGGGGGVGGGGGRAAGGGAGEGYAELLAGTHLVGTADEDALLVYGDLEGLTGSGGREGKGTKGKGRERKGRER